jgi:hypothetical protein
MLLKCLVEHSPLAVVLRRHLLRIFFDVSLDFILRSAHARVLVLFLDHLRVLV